MKSFSRLLCFIIAVGLCLSLAACGKPDEPQEKEPEPITVIINPNKKPDVDINSWELILVNRDNPLEKEINMELKSVRFGYSPMGYQVDSRIYSALENMFAAAYEDGINLCLVSAYRSISKQQDLYDNKINYFLGQGYSSEDAVAETEKVLSIPGRSEHHTGLAVDVTSEAWVKKTGGTLTDDFAQSKAGIWLAEHCTEFGFIIRYPADKEDITQISYEPWHLRYVGKENAKFIAEKGFCLEEYIKYLSE